MKEEEPELFQSVKDAEEAGNSSTPVFIGIFVGVLAGGILAGMGIDGIVPWVVGGIAGAIAYRLKRGV